MNKKYVNFETDITVSKYFKEVRKSVILTQAEEIDLAIKIKNGDEKAIHKLVNANLKFVISIAKEYQGQGLTLSDLISEGNYGLIKAASKFDHTRGFRFISYAIWWIKQSIIESLHNNARIVRLPSNVISKLTYLSKEVAKFEHINEREPVFGEIFDKDDEVMKLLKFPSCSSLDDVINDEGDELIQLIVGEHQIDNQEAIDLKLKNKINETLSVLNERERCIIESYFGLNTDLEPMTLDAIGEKYDISKERVRQIKKNCIRKLRNNNTSLYNLVND